MSTEPRPKTLNEKPAMVRTFVALPTSARQRSDLARDLENWRRTAPASLESFRFANPDQAHVTLVFLGQTEVAALPQLTDVLREVAGRHARFSWSLGDLRAVPDASRARVVWRDVTRGGAEVAALQADVSATLGSAGLYRPDGRRFQPHVTLARARRKPARMPQLQLSEGTATTARDVALVASQLGASGARHEVLASVPLGRGDG